MNSSPDDLTTPEDSATPTDARHPDPISGEPGAHPVSVGVGAIGAGLAGAAIGAVGGPIGVLIGAAIGAVAGGLAGKEVAEADDAPSVRDDGTPVSGPSAENVFPAAGGMAGMFAGGVPAATLAGLPSMAAPGSNLEAAAEREAAGSSPADLPITAAQPFHDTFTGTTFRETEAEAGMAPGDLRDMGDTGAMQEDIRTAAYYRYIDREAAGQPGDALGDWVAAEQDILQD